MHPKKRNPFRRIEPVLQQEGFVYTFLFLFFILNVLYFFIGAVPEWRRGHDSHDGLFIRFVRATGRGSGSILNFNSGLVILVASKLSMGLLRKTPLNMVVPFDKAMPKFHALVGSNIGIAGLLHTICHLINYGVNDSNTKQLHWHVALAITGVILFVCILGIRFTTTDTVSSAMSYETWYVCHIAGMVTFFTVLIIHGRHHGKSSSYKFVVGPLILYCLDSMARRMKNVGKFVLVPGYTAKIAGYKIIKLRMNKPSGFKFVAGQYCYLKVPKISPRQWHPFSIASSPHEPYLTFYIKIKGDWTLNLYKMCLVDAETIPMPCNITMFVRGPFGCPAQHTSQYEHVILISNGIGATPFTSITKHAHNIIMHDEDALERYKSLRIPHVFAEEAKRRPKHRRESDARSEGSSEPPSGATFFSRLGGAANRTFFGIHQSLRNGNRPDTDATTPWHSEDERASEKTQSIPENSLELEGREYERMLTKQGESADSSLLRADPYINVGKDDNSEEDNLFESVGWKDRARIILHSVTMNWFLLWLMLLRFSVIIFGELTGLFDLKQSGLCIYSHPALNAIDLALSIILLISIVATLLIEISSYGLWGFFYRAFGNIFDFFILIPLAFSCVLLHILGFLKIGKNSHHVSKVIVFGVWPVLSIFMLWRIIRTIGPRVAQAQFLSLKLARTKSLDLLIINKHCWNDGWIIDELLPIAKSEKIRIHRFLTGENAEKYKNKKLEKFVDPPIKTTYKKPDWKKVFLNVVENAPSGSVIGVFFCGHPGALRDIQDAALNAMRQSQKNAKKWNYDRHEKDKAGSNSEEAALGCDIRISVRSELADLVRSRTPQEKIIDH